MTNREEQELSFRAVVLGVVLSAILSAANAYLGLFAGMTVSASIPAAVISMALLKALGGTILENNLVQTAASAGESAAAGAIFTLPALVLLGAWARFDLLLCAALIGIGGLLGVLFTILLRPALVVDSALPFPEGTATAEVLRAGHEGGRGEEGRRGFRLLIAGGLLGSVAKFIESGLSWSRSVVEGAFDVRGAVFYFGSGVSPALIAVGAIVGLEVALVVFIGGAINWVCVLPFVAEVGPDGSALDAAWTAWSQKTRYLGVGAMTIGGFAALYEVRSSIAIAVRAGLRALRTGGESAAEVPLPERDLPARGVLVASALCVIPVFFVFWHITGEFGISILLAVLVLLFGFLFSSVAGYMAGLVGSSNNPVSGVTIATILFTSLLLSALGVSAVAPSVASSAGPAAAILVGSVVCTAAAIGGDNMQDLRAGLILKATPYRQQIMQIVGVVAAAFVLGPVLQILMDAYGFGSPTEEHPNALRAPQATLMASVAEGVFGGSLPWHYFFAGVGIGLFAQLLDVQLVRRKASFRVPVLALALGLYLPWELSGPILMGGLLAHVARRKGNELVGGARGGLLAGAGLITGEALMGIFLAALVGLFGGLDFLRLGGPIDSIPLSLGIVGCALYFLWRAFRARV